MFKKITEVNPLFLIMGMFSLVIAVSAYQNQFSFGEMVVLIIMASSLMLAVHYGSVVIKILMSFIAVLYFISLYTQTVTEIYGSITEPFLFSLSQIFIFLAFSYRKSQYSLRSRPLWTAILAIFLATIKISLIISGFSLLATEIASFVLLAMFILLWAFTIDRFKRTRIFPPKVSGEFDLGDFHVVEIKNGLDSDSMKWKGLDFNKFNNNSLPYIFTNLLSLHEDKRTLVLWDTSSDLKKNKKLDVYFNKAKSIDYLYIVSKDRRYLEESIKELTRDKRNK